MISEIEYHSYRPGALAGIVQLHMDYYHQNWQFGLPFETKVASELAAFLSRMDEANDLFITAYNKNGQILGSIAIDAVHRECEGAHLRWFIVHQECSGKGIGRELLGRALGHCDRRGFRRVFLTTFNGLSAARALYDSAGFQLDSESDEDQWKGGVVEQRFVRYLPTESFDV